MQALQALTYHCSFGGRFGCLRKKFSCILALVAIAPLDLEYVSFKGMLFDRYVLRNRESVKQSLFGRIMHTAAALTIVTKPYIWDDKFLNRHFIVLNFDLGLLK